MGYERFNYFQLSNLTITKKIYCNLNRILSTIWAGHELSNYHLFGLQNHLDGKNIKSIDKARTVLNGYFSSQTSSFWEWTVENNGQNILD